ncbi:MAG: LacI family DNA-binding transcriptional regulator [Oliverpabstia sp.]
MTISEIARLAGVSKATVSRVINQSGYVSNEVYDKVKEVIKNTGYVPSSTARLLSKCETDTIGVIISEIANPYFAEAFEGISIVADEYDLNVFFYNTDCKPEKERKALRMLGEQRVKGIIIAPTTDFDDVVAKKELDVFLNKADCPVVFLDASTDLDMRDGVFFDNFLGAYQAVEALIKVGHREIGILTGDRRVKIVRDRFNGYQRALMDNGIEIDERFIFEGDFTIESAYQITKEKIRDGNLPKAIFTSNNFSTIGFMKAAIENGIELQKDVVCMSFDKVDSADMFGIRYNYLQRNPKSMGEIAMRLLLNRIENPDMPCTRQIMQCKIVML